jgi:hypothetical protein
MAAVSSQKAEMEKNTIVHAETIQSVNKDAESQVSHEDEKVVFQNTSGSLDLR